MNESVSTSLVELVDAYCNVWCEADPEQRQQQLSSVWSSGATYTDPTVHAASSAELLAHIEKVLARRPGARVVRTSEIDEHHGCLRFAWRVIQADRTALPEGIDFMEVTSDGKIKRIVGFFGPLEGIETTQQRMAGQ
jgi:hypothetical protein